jgi:uncharacterized membrane protein YcaP (DUF421 family)
MGLVASTLHEVFSLPFTVTVGEKVLRAVLVYIFLLVILRFVGKRELGQQNTLDLIVLLLIANAVQNAIIGADNSFTGAVISVATLVVLNETLNRTAFFSQRLSWLLNGSEEYLIKDGKPVTKSLFSSGISLPELRSIARRQGYADLGEVNTAILESNGVVSLFKEGEPQIYHPAEPGGLHIGKRRRARP